MDGRKHRAIAATARLGRHADWILLTLALTAASIGAAHSQPLIQAAAPPSDPGHGPDRSATATPDPEPGLTAAPKGDVIHPPASVDPHMATAPPNPEAFPTPIIRPPAPADGTTQAIPK